MSKKIISIDVGIKNLAFCLFNNKDILLWNVVNLSQKTEVKCSMECCNSIPKFSKNTAHYCLKHAKKHDKYKIAKSDLAMTSIKKCCAK